MTFSAYSNPREKPGDYDKRECGDDASFDGISIGVCGLMSEGVQMRKRAMTVKEYSNRHEICHCIRTRGAKSGRMAQATRAFFTLLALEWIPIFAIQLL